MRKLSTPAVSPASYADLDWRGTILVGSALREGLLQAVAEDDDGPRSAPEVARDLGLDSRAVYNVLSALAELGLLKEWEGRFKLLEEHRAQLLDRGHPNYAGGSIVHLFEVISHWSHLPEVLKSGEPAEDRASAAFGGPASFIQAMRLLAGADAEAIAEMVLPYLAPNAHVLDVGGGPGNNAEAFIKGGARVTVFDRPQVVEFVEGPLREAGVSVVAGDMNESLPKGPFDALYFGNISHMYGPDENKAVLAKARDALRPGGLLVIRDWVRGLSEEAALFGVTFLLLTRNGGTYTAEEYKTWLAEAGFVDFAVLPIPNRGTHMVLARKPG